MSSTPNKSIANLWKMKFNLLHELLFACSDSVANSNNDYKFIDGAIAQDSKNK